MLSEHSAAQEIKHLWKFTSGFIEPKILNFEGSLSLSLGPQKAVLFHLAKFLLETLAMLIMIRNLTYSDLDSCDPEVMVSDARVFSSIKNGYITVWYTNWRVFM